LCTTFAAVIRNLCTTCAVFLASLSIFFDVMMWYVGHWLTGIVNTTFLLFCKRCGGDVTGFKVMDCNLTINLL